MTFKNFEPSRVSDLYHTLAIIVSHLFILSNHEALQSLITDDLWRILNMKIA